MSSSAASSASAALSSYAAHQRRQRRRRKERMESKSAIKRKSKSARKSKEEIEINPKGNRKRDAKKIKITPWIGIRCVRVPRKCSLLAVLLVAILRPPPNIIFGSGFKKRRFRPRVAVYNRHQTATINKRVTLYKTATKKPPPIPIFVVVRSFIVERALCRKEGLNIDVLLRDFEFNIKVARLGSTKWITVLDREEDFEHAKLKEKAWWARWFDSVQPWPEEIQADTSRDVWLRCFRVPMHAYCVNTFMSIGYAWEEVLGVELGSLESGNLVTGRVCIRTKAMSFLQKEIELRVENLSFNSARLLRRLGLRRWRKVRKRRYLNGRNPSKLGGGGGTLVGIWIE
ncbi:hypothetical protein Dimus_005777 [Dionaea muscipula]